jgi:tetratricopeptide (TPR) repeat protein
MMCRVLLVVLLAWLPLAAGCTYPVAGVRLVSGQSAPPAPAKDKDKDDMVHKASTYVAFGDFRAAAGFSKDIPPAQQQVYREDARLSYLRAIEVDPKHLPAYLALTTLQQRCEDYAGASATLQKALTLDNRDHRLWYELGMCQCRQKKWDDALVSIGRAVGLNPGHKPYLATLGYAQGRAGRLAESLQTLTAVHGPARAHFDVARLLQHMNQPMLAAQQAMLASSLDANLPGLSQFLAALQRQASGEGAGQIQQATASGVTSPGVAQAVASETSAAGSPGQAPGASPIRLPPLPVISIRSRGN